MSFDDIFDKTHFMKYLLTTFIFLLTLNSSYALPNKFGNVDEFRKHIKSLKAENNRAKAKTTNTYWRLSSSSFYGSTGSGLSISDSGIYKYSNARGSSFDYEYLEYYDYGVDPEYNTIFTDTVYRFSDQGAGFEMNERYISSYDANNQRTSFTDAQGSAPLFTNSERENGVYDANGNLITEAYQTWGGTTWTNTFAYYYKYNSNNKVTLDSGYNNISNAPAYKAVYSYDVNGNMTESIVYDRISNAWVPSFKANIYYDAANRDTLDIYQTYNNSSSKWVDMYKDSTSYHNATNMRKYNIIQVKDTVNNVWINNSRDMRTFNSMNKPSVVTYESWDTTSKTWSDKTDVELTYNNNGDPTKMEAYLYVNGTKQTSPFTVSYMYYEHYFNVGIEDRATASTTIDIYPNPASNYVAIDSKGESLRNITLFNMVGQTQITLTPPHQSHHRLDINNLPKGIYFLRIETAENKTVTKRLVIQ